MPPIFKALISISVWLLFVKGGVGVIADESNTRTLASPAVGNDRTQAYGLVESIA